MEPSQLEVHSSPGTLRTRRKPCRGTSTPGTGRAQELGWDPRLTLIPVGVVADAFVTSIKWNIFHGPCAPFQRSRLKKEISPGASERLRISGGCGSARG